MLRCGWSADLLFSCGWFFFTNSFLHSTGPTLELKAMITAAITSVHRKPSGVIIFTTLSVEENLRIGTYMRSDKSGIDKDFRRVMDLFPVLAERRGQPAGKLSGGEQQMLAIGRALLTKPRIMTIDEPSLGLAPALVNRVYAVLLELREKENLTLLIVEQSSERALKTADRIYVLRDGQVQIEGKAADLQDGVKVHQAYFGFTEADGPGDKVEF